MERTEAGYNRAEPTPRWRSLLDRARAGGRSAVDETELAGAYSPSVVPQRLPEGPPPGYGAGSVGGPGGPGPGGLGGRIEWQPAQPANSGVDQLVAGLRRNIGGPKVFAFANPKGGVHKTTATVLAAATIGGVRGRGVIAWDDNELRGTLGLRAGSARHARTIRHLVNDLPELEATPSHELGEVLDDYLRHASDGSYDVLAGEESPRFARQLDPYTVRRVMELLRRTHDVICVDTGNNVESPNWQTVIQMADQLVITSVPREDAAFTADWMLDLLHETGMSELANNAVTLLSLPDAQPVAAAQRPGPPLRDAHAGGGDRALRPGAGERLVDRAHPARARRPGGPGCRRPRCCWSRSVAEPGPGLASLASGSAAVPRAASRPIVRPAS